MSMSTAIMNMDPSLQDRVSHAVENANAIDSIRASAKRKRDPLDHGDGNQVGSKRGPSQSSANGNSNDFSTLSEQLQRGMANANNAQGQIEFSMMPSIPQMNVPQPTDLSFAQTASTNDTDRQVDSSFAMSGEGNQNHEEQFHYDEPYNGPQPPTKENANGSSNKPAVGTDEWHKQRRDNHKEVERRRRETINEGINEIAKIVPGCGKNKGEILSRAVSYITQLKTNEQGNIDKWTMEKVITDQALAALSTKIDEQKTEIEKQRLEIGRLRRMLQGAGMPLPDSGGGDDRGDA